MASMSRNPDDNAPWLELGEILRPAVQQVRHAPPPPDALERSLQRARQIGRRPPRSWFLRPPQLLVGGAVAATLLIATLSHLGSLSFNGRGNGQPPVNSSTLVNQAGKPADDALAFDGNPRMLIRGGSPFLAPQNNDHVISLTQIRNQWGHWEHVEGLSNLRSNRSAVLGLIRHDVRKPSTRVTVPPYARIRALADKAPSLQGVYVQVKIEGMRARTLIDHVFHNPLDEPISGFLECPLPEGASPSFVTIFNGKRTSSSVTVTQTKPRAAYSFPSLPCPQDAANQIQPSCWGEPQQAHVVPVYSVASSLPEGTPKGGMALQHSNDQLEPSSVLRGPIGTIPARTHFRVMIAYEEDLLPRMNRLAYEFLLPDRKLFDLSFTLQADTTTLVEPRFIPDASSQVGEGRIQFTRKWHQYQPETTTKVQFSAIPVNTGIQSICGRHSNGSRYLVAKLRPRFLNIHPTPFAQHAIFLLDTSVSEQPERFARYLTLLRNILENDHSIKQFNILTFNAAAGWLQSRRWIANTPQERRQALNQLDNLVLEGASNLAATLHKVAQLDLPLEKTDPVHCFLLSDGRITWGEKDPRLLAGLLEQSSHPQRWHCYQTESPDENTDLFHALTRRGGGIYRCVSDRDIDDAAHAHKRVSLQIKEVRFVGEPKAHDVLLAGRQRMVQSGGSLVVGARFESTGRGRLVLEGTIQDKPITQSFPVVVHDQSQLAPRAWAQIAVESLLDAGGPRLESLAMAYAQEFGIATRLTAFCLTNEPPQLDSESERRRLGRGELNDWIERRFNRLVRLPTAADRRVDLRQQIRAWAPTEWLRWDLLDLCNLLPDSELQRDRVVAPPASLLTRKIALPSYLDARQKARHDVRIYLEEALRRECDNQPESALRALSTILKETPNNPEAIRIVAYHLVGTKRATLAIDLLQAHVEQNPEDPVGHRALAVALSETNRPGLAALHYELALALLGNRGGWYSGVREEYLGLLRAYRRNPNITADLRDRFQSRWQEMERSSPGELRVSATWNTAASEVQLQVVDEKGTVLSCTTPSRGNRQGPVIFNIAKMQGAYTIKTKLIRTSAETSPETGVIVEILQHAGTQKEKIERKLLLLHHQGEECVVGKVGK